MKIKIFDFNLEVNYSFLILLTVLFYKNVQTTLASILAVLIHETGHILAICLKRYKINKLNISIFGFIIEKSLPKNGMDHDDILVPIMGPAFNLVASIVSASVYTYVFTNKNFFYLLALNNFFLFLLNILPIKGLDGGQIFYKILIRKKDPGLASKILNKVSTALSIFLLMPCLFILVNYNYNPTLIIIFFYLIAILLFKLEKNL